MGSSQTYLTFFIIICNCLLLVFVSVGWCGYHNFGTEQLVQEDRESELDRITRRNTRFNKTVGHKEVYQAMIDEQPYVEIKNENIDAL